MRVVITGGAGFIGANLARTMTEAGTAVTIVDDLSTGRRDNLADVEAPLYVGSVLDPTVLSRAFRGADSVVHLAAIPSVPRSIRNPVASHHANVTGTVEVLEAARRCGVPHVVLASSSSVYGANPQLPKTETMRTAPLSPYAVSKLAAESYALAYQHSFGLGVLAFRFFNVFGPLQPANHAYAAVVPAFVDAALAGRPIPIDGDGTQSRDFTFVGSLVQVLSQAVERQVTCDGPVNLAFGGRTSLNELVGLLEELLETPLPREHRPRRAGDVPHSQADDRRLRSLFPGLRPVPLEEGIRETVAWFRGRTVLGSR